MHFSARLPFSRAHCVDRASASSESHLRGVFRSILDRGVFVGRSVGENRADTKDAREWEVIDSV